MRHHHHRQQEHSSPLGRIPSGGSDDVSSRGPRRRSIPKDVEHNVSHTSGAHREPQRSAPSSPTTTSRRAVGHPKEDTYHGPRFKDRAVRSSRPTRWEQSRAASFSHHRPHIKNKNNKNRNKSSKKDDGCSSSSCSSSADSGPWDVGIFAEDSLHYPPKPLWLVQLPPSDESSFLGDNTLLCSDDSEADDDSGDDASDPRPRQISYPRGVQRKMCFQRALVALPEDIVTTTADSPPLGTTTPTKKLRLRTALSSSSSLSSLSTLWPENENEHEKAWRQLLEKQKDRRSVRQQVLVVPRRRRSSRRSRHQSTTKDDDKTNNDTFLPCHPSQPYHSSSAPSLCVEVDSLTNLIFSPPVSKTKSEVELGKTGLHQANSCVSGGGGVVPPPQHEEESFVVEKTDELIHLIVVPPPPPPPSPPLSTRRRGKVQHEEEEKAMSIQEGLNTEAQSGNVVPSMTTTTTATFHVHDEESPETVAVTVNSPKNRETPPKPHLISPPDDKKDPRRDVPRISVDAKNGGIRPCPTDDTADSNNSFRSLRTMRSVGLSRHLNRTMSNMELANQEFHQIHTTPSLPTPTTSNNSSKSTRVWSISSPRRTAMMHNSRTKIWQGKIPSTVHPYPRHPTPRYNKEFMCCQRGNDNNKFATTRGGGANEGPPSFFTFCASDTKGCPPPNHPKLPRLVDQWQRYVHGLTAVNLPQEEDVRHKK